jgi:site-specific DNA-methyltransferase (adenine-specific)
MGLVAQQAGQAPVIRRLYRGDNLAVLRKHVPTGSVSVVYLDPPFNSGRDWHLGPSCAAGKVGDLAFTDRWAWTADAALQYKELTAPDSPQGFALEWFASILGETGALAYLTHMAARFPELHRVLTPAGGLFLHVDDTMNHYLKILLDQVFGDQNFAGQIIWKRTSAHNNAKRGLPRVHDVILVYRRGDTAPWCDQDGLMNFGEHGDVWTDIPPVNRAGRERLGWPTQKPLPLLTRILTLAASPGDVVLDPNCGAGTAIEAAQQQGLGWIGIDLSDAAIDLTQARLAGYGADYEVHGTATAPPPDGTLF